MVLWGVGKYGTQDDGLDEADMMVRVGGREGEEKLRYLAYLSPSLPPSLPPSLLTCSFPVL